MTQATRKTPNRGPAAAASNRAALLQAAREVFAAGGIGAPLSEVARRAGVGQGSLYRHFPDRVALAVTVFESNVTELEDLAAEPTATLHDLLGLLTRQIVESTAFVELVRTADDARVQALADRTASVLLTRLGRDPLSTTGVGEQPGDLQLAIGMVAGAVSGAPDDQRMAVAARAWALLGVPLQGPPDDDAPPTPRSAGS